MKFLIYVPSISVLVLFLSGVQAARGLDTGAPLFRGDMDAGVTFEVQYERFDRDIRQEVAFTEDTFSGQQQEDRTRVYIQAYPRSNLTVRLDLGVVSSENATRVVPLVGAMAKYRLAAWGDTRLSLSAGGYYVDGIKYNRSGALTPVAEFAAVERTESYIEWGGDLQLSHAWKLTPDWTLHPYAAVTASWLDANGDERFTLETQGRERMDDSVDFREDAPVNLAVGVSGLVQKNFGARLEARFLGTASYSAAVFFSF